MNRRDVKYLFVFVIVYVPTCLVAWFVVTGPLSQIAIPFIRSFQNPSPQTTVFLVIGLVASTSYLTYLLKHVPPKKVPEEVV